MFSDRTQEQVESGQLADADAVVASALELLIDQQESQRLRELIAEGDASFARGENAS